MDSSDREEQDFQILTEHLTDDVQLAAAQIRDVINTQTWRRAYVRSIFAVFEAVLAFLKRQVQLAQAGEDLCLTPSQQKWLDESSSSVGRDGRLKRRSHRLPFLKDVPFTFKMFASSACFSVKINKAGPGWTALAKSSEVWQRVTVPRTSADAIVTDEEVESLNTAYDWFMKTYECLLQKSLDSLLGQIEGLRRAIRGNGIAGNREDDQPPE